MIIIKATQNKTNNLRLEKKESFYPFNIIVTAANKQTSKQKKVKRLTLKREAMTPETYY